jgi:hypothetical protein
MKRSGAADLPLHYGSVPPWLAERMSKLGLAITEAIITEYGPDEILRRLSDPFWFQSLGAVLGMDWHSSGITTSVMGALKKAINPRAKELGLFICGGKGKLSKETPAELIRIANATGLDGNELVRCSKLSAKVDNTAVQDGFQLYMHNFILNANGKWTVVQQGMHAGNKTARRYHWHADNLDSFVETPHTGVCGINQGEILNLTAADAAVTRNSLLNIAKEDPGKMIAEISHLQMPSHHDVQQQDVDLKRLGAILYLANENSIENFEELLLLKGMGPRTIQSLTLVSEVIHGTPSRFSDPARFSFAHGGKDGHPFPVPTQVYDETIESLEKAVQKAKLNHTDKAKAIKNLHTLSMRAEKDFIPNNRFDELIGHERDNSWKYGGKTIYGDAKPPRLSKKGVQLKLF